MEVSAHVLTELLTKMRQNYLRVKMHFQKQLEEYSSRYNKWDHERRSQLSFFNNLILTFSIGFLAYVFKLEELNSLSFSICNINWRITLLVFSMVCLTASVFLGLLAAWSRLQDFRITARIALTRKRVYEHSHCLLREEESTPMQLSQRLCLLFQCFSYEKKFETVSLTNCEKYSKDSEDFNKAFKELRTIAHKLGLKTWISLIFQLVFFGLALIFFVISQLC